MTTRRALDFEYAIKKDVRNNPIVREIDEERQRQLWRTAGISAVLVLVVLFSAWQTLELVLHGYEVQRLERERASEEEVNRHLRLEIETLRSPKRIEEMAIKDLKLVAPARDQAIVIERVTPAAPPDKSIVALRGTPGRERAPPPGLGPLNQPAQEATVAEQQAGSGGARDPRSARGVQHGELPHAPTPNVAWRSTLSTRVLTAAGPVRAVDGRHPGASGLPAGHRSRRHAGARRSAAHAHDRRAGQARRDRRPQRPDARLQRRRGQRFCRSLGNRAPGQGRAARMRRARRLQRA